MARTLREQKGKAPQRYLSRREQGKIGDKWSKNKQKISAVCCNGDGTGGINTQQLEQLLRLLLLQSKSRDEDSRDDMEVNYAELVEGNMTKTLTKEWISDS